MPLTDDEFQVFTRDVAARIIQSRWRQWQAWKLQVGGSAAARWAACVCCQLQMQVGLKGGTA